MTKDELLHALRGGEDLTRRQQLKLVVLLGGPAMMAQMAGILMQYIDASMVARLGAGAMGSIGLVCSSLWLAMGLCSALATGFYVMASHRVGARKYGEARRVMNVSIPASLAWSIGLGALGWALAPWLPGWLGGEATIQADAARYFRILMLCMPVWQINMLASGLLRSAGNLKVPSMLNIMMCLLDVAFNYVFIFRLGMGVEGAAWGTVAAEAIAMAGLLVCLFRQKEYKAPKPPSYPPKGGRFSMGLQSLLKHSPLGEVEEAIRLATPMGFERIFLVGAQIASTVIVAPLGTVALAANALGITIESLCYMPGFGIGDAASTLVGQSHGAGRPALVFSFSRITLWLGVGVMTLTGAIMYVGAPALVGLMGPEAEVGSLCAHILRIEAFAEPMYGASIVGYCIFVALGDSKMPCLMNLATIWGIRITLAALLAPTYGLPGVWLAMAIELTVRGLIFLLRLHFKVKPHPVKAASGTLPPLPE